MDTLLWILLVTLLDGLAAFAGAFTLVFKGKTLKNLLFVLVAFSAGVMIGGGLLHLLVESLETLEADIAMVVFIVGFSVFFLIERLLHWHHCHTGGACDVHTYSYLVLIGDGIHNFIDGLVISAAFITNIGLGLVTSLLILGHELPQEIGDFAVLLHGGMKKGKALLYNFLSQLTAVIGGLAGYFWLYDELRILLLPFAAGGFIYIAASDLIPELHKEPRLSRAMLAFGFFTTGVLFMLGVKILAGGLSG